MKKNIIRIVGIVFLAILAVSCAAKAEPVLKLTGLAEKAWTANELKSLPSSSSDYTNKDGETTTYTGVTFTSLFEAASLSDYSTVTLVAADDYTAEITKDELAACPTCIVAILEDGSLRSVMPGLSGKQQVKDLVEIQVK
ncbi:MAG: hypothetical protein Q8N39_08030 [Pelolinea sp.]|nr:hypothetical protein [Pelolinea sp.]